MANTSLSDSLSLARSQILSSRRMSQLEMVCTSALVQKFQQLDFLAPLFVLLGEIGQTPFVTYFESIHPLLSY
jgi:hypothetical protein